MIKFYCKFCGTRNIARNSQAGQEMLCSHCGKLISIPEVSDPKAAQQDSSSGMRPGSSSASGTGTSMDETAMGSAPSSPADRTRLAVGSEQSRDLSKRKMPKVEFKLSKKAPKTESINLDNFSDDADPTNDSVGVGHIGDDAILPLDFNEKEQEMIEHLEALHEAGVIKASELERLLKRVQDRFTDV